MTDPLISVIVPVYNVEKFLPRCIESVLRQSYDKFELILVDDGSPDKCGEICDRYAREDQRIRVVHKPNGGLSDARNAGTDIASGEYITFVDSDDYITDDYLEYLYSLLNGSNAEVSCADYFETESMECEKRPQCDETVRIFSGRQACESQFGSERIKMVIACCKLIKAEIVKKYLFPAGHNHEDEATTFKFYYDSSKVVVGSRCCYGYFQNPASIVHQKLQSADNDMYWACMHRFDFYKSRNEKELSKGALRITAHYLMNCNLRGCPDAHNVCARFLKRFFFSGDMTLRTKIGMLFLLIDLEGYRRYVS